MSEEGNTEPQPQGADKPPKRKLFPLSKWGPIRKWRAKEPFFDLKISHWVQIALTVALVGIGYLQWTVYSNQLAETQTEYRPWVYSTDTTIDGPITNDPNGTLSMALAFKLKNVGHSPAQHLFISFDIYMMAYSPKNAVTKACKDAEDSRNAFTLFPDSVVQQGDGQSVTASDIAALKAERARVGGSGANAIPAIVACVAYQFADGGKFHHTPYLFILQYIGADGSRVLPLDQPGIAANLFTLISMPFDQIGPAD